jgi:hypothetical protein
VPSGTIGAPFGAGQGAGQVIGFAAERRLGRVISHVGNENVEM